MSVYNLVPSPDLSTLERNFATWENGFSESEITQVRELGDLLPTEQATVDLQGVVSDLRKSRVGWVELTPNTGWLYDRLGFIANQMNGRFFDFALSGFVEHFQYTVYQGDGGCYDWHMDKGLLNSSPRKLSLVVQLSDPGEYEGGDLQLMVGADPIIAERKKGLVYAFPSWILHRVTPVTRGTRRSLVIWLAGPKFR